MPASEIVGLDPSAAFIAYAQKNAKSTRAHFEVGDAQALKFKDASFDQTLALLVMNFVPDHGKAIAEMRRVTRPQGTVSACVWEYDARMEMLRFFWTKPSRSILHRNQGQAPHVASAPGPAWRGAGRSARLVNVQGGTLVIDQAYSSFNDYRKLSTKGAGPGGGLRHRPAAGSPPAARGRPCVSGCLVDRSGRPLYAEEARASVRARRRSEHLRSVLVTSRPCRRGRPRSTSRARRAFGAQIGLDGSTFHRSIPSTGSELLIGDEPQGNFKVTGDVATWPVPRFATRHKMSVVRVGTTAARLTASMPRRGAFVTTSSSRCLCLCSDRRQEASRPPTVYLSDISAYGDAQHTVSISAAARPRDRIRWCRRSRCLSETGLPDRAGSTLF